MSLDVGTAVGYLDLDIKGFESGIKSATQQLGIFNSDTATSGQKMEALGGVMKSAGANMTKFMTVPLAGVGALSVKTSMDVESAFAGVQKTMDTTGLSTQQAQQRFQELTSGIMDMSGRMPTAATEIAGVAEAAGQLGIKTENVLGFTETMVMLGDTTNLSADEAATSLARLANITGMPQTEFDKLGSTIVALGNNMATTESEITAMGLRLAAAGSQVGMTEPQIMSFASALSSVGIEAEAGGTAFSKVMIDMQLATEQGGEKLDNFAKVAGMSSKEFQAAFKEDAAGAIMSFIEGLGKAEEQGQSTIGILENMGISEVRLRDALLRASNASGVFSEALDIGNKAWEENNALTNEAKVRYETTESKLAILKNKFIETGTSIGNVLIPSFNDMIDCVSNILDWFNELDSGTQTFIVSIGGLVAVIGPLLVIGGTLLTMLPNMALGFELVTGAVASMNVAVLGVPLAVAGLVAALVGLVTYVGTSTSALEFLQDKFGALGIFIGTVCEFIAGVVQLTFGNMIILITTAAKMIGAILTGHWSKVDDIWREGWAKIENNTAEALSNIAAETNSALELLKSTSADKLGNVVDTFDLAMKELPNLTKDNAGKIAQNFTEQLTDLDDKSLTILRGTSDTMAVLFEGIYENMNPEEATAKFTANLESMATSGKFNMDTIKTDIDSAMKTINENMLIESEAFKQTATNMFNEFKTAATQGMPEAINNVVSLLGTMNQETVTQLSSMGDSWKQVFQGINLDSGMTTQQMKDTVTNNINAMGLDASQLIDLLRSESSNYMKQMAQDADQNTKQLSLNVDKNIKSGTDKGTKNVKDLASNVDKETKNVQQKGDANTKQYASDVDKNTKSGTDKAKANTGNLAKNTDSDTKKAGSSAKSNMDAGSKAVTSATSKMSQGVKKDTSKVASDIDTDFKKGTRSVQQESTNMYNGAKQSFTKLAQVAKQAGSDAYNGINNSFKKIPGIVSSNIATAASNASAHTSSFKTAGQSAGQAWIDGFNSKKSAMSTAVANIPQPKSFNVRSAVALNIQPNVSVNTRSLSTRSFAAVSSGSSSIISAVTNTLTNAASSLDITSSYKRAGENAANAFIEGLSVMIGQVDGMWNKNEERWESGLGGIEKLQKDHEDRLVKYGKDRNKKLEELDKDWAKKSAEAQRVQAKALDEAERKKSQKISEANSKYAKDRKKRNEAIKKADQEYREAERKATEKHNETMSKANQDYWEKKVKINEDYAEKEKESLEKLNSDKEKLEEDRAEAERLFKENLLDIQEKYHQKVQDLNEKYINEEKKLNDEYQKIYESRVNSLMGWSDIFAEVKMKDDVSGSQLVDNLQQQVEIFKTWDEDMNDLAGKVGKGLYDELLKKGPQAHQEIAALNRLSQKELERYEQLFEEKKRMAEERAKQDTEDEKNRIENEIAGLKDKYLAEYEKLGKDMADEVQKQIDTINKKFGAVPQDFLQSGKLSILEFIKGLESMEGSLYNTVERITSKVVTSVRGAVKEINDFKRGNSNISTRDLMNSNERALSASAMSLGYSRGIESNRNTGSSESSNSRNDNKPSVNIYNTYNSPKQASIRELKRQEEVQLRKLGYLLR